MISYMTKEKTMSNKKPNLIRKNSKAGFLNFREKVILEAILEQAFENTGVQDTETRHIVSDIFEKVTTANVINFDYEDDAYLKVLEK